MKIRIVFVLVLALGAMFAPSASYASDAERVAQYLALHPMTGCVAYGSSYQNPSQTGEYGNYTYFTARVKKTGEITSLVKDGIELVVDEPLPGFPEREDGSSYQNFFASFSCHTSRGEYDRVLDGTFSDASLEAGEPIVVSLSLSERDTVFAPDFPSWVNDPSNLSLTVEDGNGYTYAYDQYAGGIGGFRLWVNPVDVFSFTIRDATGVRVMSGSYDPFVGEIVPGSEEVSSGIGLVLPDGIVEVVFPKLNEWGYATRRFTEQKLDGVVKRDGAEVPAKVYLVEAQKSGLCVDTYSSTPEVLHVEIRNARTLVLVAEGDYGVSTNEVGKFIVTVTNGGGAVPYPTPPEMGVVKPPTPPKEGQTLFGISFNIGSCGKG